MEGSGREAGCLRRRQEDAQGAIRRSGDPAIRRSGDPAIRRSGDPAIRRSGDPAIRRSGDPAIRRSGDPAIRRSGDYGFWGPQALSSVFSGYASCARSWPQGLSSVPGSTCEAPAPSECRLPRRADNLPRFGEKSICEFFLVLIPVTCPCNGSWPGEPLVGVYLAAQMEACDRSSTAVPTIRSRAFFLEPRKVPSCSWPGLSCAPFFLWRIAEHTMKMSVDYRCWAVSFTAWSGLPGHSSRWPEVGRMR